MKSILLKKLFPIALTVICLVSLGAATSLASSKKTSLPTSITAYDYVNGKYVKVRKTETLHYNKLKRPDRVRDFYGNVWRMTYSVKSGDIRKIRDDLMECNVSLNKKGYVTGINLKDRGPYSVRRADNGRIKSVKCYNPDNKLGYKFSASYKFRSSGILSKTILEGMYYGVGNESVNEEMSYNVGYDKNGFVISSDYKQGLVRKDVPRERLISKYEYTRDSKGRITTIIRKDKNEKGKYVTVGKYVLKYDKKITTTNKGTLRSIVNTLIVGKNYYYTDDVVVVNAFRRDKPIPADLSYRFTKTQYFLFSPLDEA